MPMLMTCTGVCLLRVLWVLIAVPISHQIQTLLFSYPLSWVITSILFLIYYRYSRHIRSMPKLVKPEDRGGDKGKRERSHCPIDDNSSGGQWLLPII